MANNSQELQYKISVELSNAMRDVGRFRQELEQTKVKMQEIQRQGSGNGIAVHFEAMAKNASTLTRQLGEVRRALDLMRQGYVVVGDASNRAFSVKELRVMEKTLEDMIQKLRSASFNNIEKAMNAMHSAAVKENAEVDKLIRNYERLNRIKNDTSKTMPSSSYYDRRGQMQGTVNRLNTYGIQRSNTYGESYGSYANVRRAITAEQEYTREIEKQNAMLQRGNTIRQQEYELSVRNANAARAKYINAGGNAAQLQSMPFSQNLQTINGGILERNAVQWAQGYSRYSTEISRLKGVQEQLYQTFLRDPSEKNFRNLTNCRTAVQRLTAEYRNYNRVLGQTRSATDSFFGKIRSHLYWITAGTFLASVFSIPSHVVSRITTLDEKMINLSTVMPSIEHNMAAMNKEQSAMIDVARQYGESVDEVIESARLWGRMYKDVETVNVLTSQSAKLAVADNFSLAESTKDVEAAMFQFGMVAHNAAEALAYSNKIVDVYTALSHQAGVSAQDLAMGVERSGAVAHQAGVDFEFLTALIAQGTRATALSGAEIPVVEDGGCVFVVQGDY